MEKDSNQKRDVKEVLRIIDKMIDLIVDNEEIEDYRPLIETIKEQLRSIGEDIEQKRKENEEIFGLEPHHFLTEYPNQLTLERNLTC